MKALLLQLVHDIGAKHIFHAFLNARTLVGHALVSMAMEEADTTRGWKSERRALAVMILPENRLTATNLEVLWIAFAAIQIY